MAKTHPTSNIGLASTARSDEGQHNTGVDDATRSQFTTAALGMSWQLAIVVLIPIVGGYELDSHYDSSPFWTLVGLVLSLVGSVLVVRRALAAFDNFSPMTTDDAARTSDAKGPHL